MKIKIGDCEITGKKGDYICQGYGMITKKGTKTMEYGKKDSQHYFGSLSQALWFTLNWTISESDITEASEIRKELLKFKEELKKIKLNP